MRLWHAEEQAAEPVQLSGCPAQPPFIVRIRVDCTQRRLAFAIDDYPFQPITTPIGSRVYDFDECQSFTAQLAVCVRKVCRRCHDVEAHSKAAVFPSNGVRSNPCGCSEVPMAKATIVQLLSTNETFDYKHIRMNPFADHIPEVVEDVWCFDRKPGCA